VSNKLRVGIAAAVVIVVVAGAGAWWFVLRDTAEPEASVAAVAADGEGDGGGAPGTIDGEWVVQQGDTVFVGYRVTELFAGDTLEKTATGRTPEVEGSMTVDGDTISEATVTADLTQLESDQNRRDAALSTRGIETGQFPDGTFALTEPITLPAAPEVGETVEVVAVGDLTMHGETAPVEVELEALWEGSTVSVAGSTPIVFADFGMEAIEIAGFVSTDDEGTMELQLSFVPA
jgi:polyisoprenoid-binding protein YceI